MQGIAGQGFKLSRSIAQDGSRSSVAPRQPGRYIRGRLEIQQGIRQGFEIGERQNLDAGLLLGGQGAEAALPTDRDC